MDARILGLLIMIISAALAINVHLLSTNLINSIDVSHTCSDVGTCSHVAALNMSYLGYLGSGAMFLLGLYIFFRPPMLAQARRAKPGKLSPDEDKIYSMIEDSGGVLFQSEIVEKSGFPKARVTRILDKLEAKEALERRRRGMTNAVVLK